MRTWMLTVALSMLTIACGDDDSAGSSNLDGKKVSELTGKELLQLCDWFLANGDGKSTDKQFCTQDAAEDASSSQECEELRDECIAELAAEDEEDEDCADFSIDKACTVAVADLKKCMTDLTKLYDDAARTASCDHYEDAIVSEFPKSCASLPEACIQIEISSVSMSGLLAR